MNDLVSIIIPVYNGREYLERCVESALRQTHENTQIIIVNDGSNDGSADICDRYAAEKPNVEVIHQQNSGVSAARNAGLDIVKGEWVVFLDADDYISKYFVELTTAESLSNNTDIVICGYISDTKGNLSEDEFTKATQTEVITNREAVLRHFNKGGGLYTIVCAKLFRASIWKDIRFPVRKRWEDLYVSHQFLYRSKTVSILNARLYAYYQSDSSFMRAPFSLKRLDVLDACQEGIRFYKQVGEPEFADIAHRIYCNRLFDACGLCKKFLPLEVKRYKDLRREIVSAYRDLKRIRSFIDQPNIGYFFIYRCKQRIGRYFPVIYDSLFLRNRYVV